MRKLRPVLDADSGTHFPQRASSGNCVPFSASIPGCSFPKDLVPESVSHSEPSNRDVLSAKGFIRKPHPALHLNSGMPLPQSPSTRSRVPFQSWDGNRIPFRGSLSNWNAASAPASATCRRRPLLLLLRRAPACGGGIRARRAWRAQGGGARAE